ncbi:MAG: gamma-glutamylcyclotransferase [Leptolyngbya sp. SIO4C1]|nr:gamma-glutamylcyclotransferase [Leptolyngbya sp. SIO4C1]
MLEVFVYGTLKPGGYYHQQYCAPYLTEAIPALVKGQLYHLPQAGYPGMTLGDDWVQGYLLRFVERQVLAGLDALEDYQPGRPAAMNEYVRSQIQVFDSQQQPLAWAWAYFMSAERVRQHQGRYLADGHWPLP